MKSRIVQLISLVIMFIGAVVLIFMGFTSLREVNSFPKTTAIVTRVDIEETTDAEGELTTEQTVYVRYNVNGQEYNEILQFSGGDYEEGQTIEARYNPDKPSYITAATKGSSMLFMGFGGVLLICTFVCVLRFLTRGHL